MRDIIVPGQRFISDAEPELGLGLVIEISARTIVVTFPAVCERRHYARDNAPLRRVVFRPGDKISSREGRPLTVAALSEQSHLITYATREGPRIGELDLADAISFATPEERLLIGQTDPSRWFDLRRRVLLYEYERRRSCVRGFTGGRMELIPHQLYIASEVARRKPPRVLLADEVGLGKAIEACLIVHRLLAVGQAARVLIVVPEALLHQWFVELLRRFDLHFKIFDERRFESDAGASLDDNPFEDEFLVLCALPLLLNRDRARQALAAEWDLLLVDEAHRLKWSAERPSAEFRVIERLSRRAQGVLLLTGTPEQGGLPGHFARLTLLDPARYHNYKVFAREAERDLDVARCAARLLGDAPLTRADQRRLHELLADEPGAIRARLEALADGDPQARADLIADLVDRHGPGRAIFRNTRAVIHGFPARQARPVPLAAPLEAGEAFARLCQEFADDADGRAPRQPHDYLADPRVLWLKDFLLRHRSEKVLLICRTPQKVRALQAALDHHLSVKIALFHEQLELIQRDRQAAWFAEEGGAQILLASEIGSEGRNFQFAHHLILFDLPLDPELLEQRIGRLDRIGQAETIEIHVPYVADSPQEVLLRWHHEGLDALAHHLHIGQAMSERFGERLRAVAQAFARRQPQRQRLLERLVVETRAAREKRAQELRESRDVLLELGSFRRGPAEALASAIEQQDRARDLDQIMQRVWSHFGVSVEELAPRLYRLGAEGSFIEGFPGLPAQGLTATLDRRRALAREDIAFLTMDHSLVTGAFDFLLARADGNAAFALCALAGARGFWLETISVLECVAPAHLHLDRFLPPTPIHAIVDSHARDVTEQAARILAHGRLAELTARQAQERIALDRERLRALLEAVAEQAERGRARIVAEARAAMRLQVGHEIERLRALAAINQNVRPREIAALEDELRDMDEAIEHARLRLDAVRVVVLTGEAASAPNQRRRLDGETRSA